MVSQRCKLMVAEILNNLGLGFSRLELGTLELTEDPSKKDQALIQDKLKEIGLELIQDKTSILVEKMNCIILDMIQHPTGL